MEPSQEERLVLDRFNALCRASGPLPEPPASVDTPEESMWAVAQAPAWAVTQRRGRWWTLTPGDPTRPRWRVFLHIFGVCSLGGIVLGVVLSGVGVLTVYLYRGPNPDLGRELDGLVIFVPFFFLSISCVLSGVVTGLTLGAARAWEQRK